MNHWVNGYGCVPTQCGWARGGAGGGGGGDSLKIPKKGHEFFIVQLNYRYIKVMKFPNMLKKKPVKVMKFYSLFTKFLLQLPHFIGVFSVTSFKHFRRFYKAPKN